MPIHCPYCNKKFQTRDLRAGRRTPQCPRCGERFVIWLEAFKLEDYKSAVETLQQNMNAGADPVPASVKASAAAAPADSDSDLEVAVQAPAARAKVASAPAVETNGSRTAETVPPPPSQASEIEQTTDFESARGVLTADLSGRPEKKNEEEVDLSLNGFSLDIAESPEAPESIATSEPAAVEGVPASLGGYKILKELGRGGMGSVFLANQVSLDRRVAVKTIRTELADDPIFLSRFTREAYAAAQLVHHNVVQVYDLGEDRGTHFFSMEFVEGLPLDKLISRGKALDSHDAVGYILQAARGLQFAHDHGMVHRDIKPANLLLNSHGVVKVADLGLVKTAGSEADDAAQVANPVIKSALDTKATAAGSTMGTPAFMAPEQAGDAAGVDHRADIYSLGCTLYSLVTGRLPFEGKTAIEVITKHKTEPLARPERVKAGVPSDVGDVVDLMTAKRPDDRPHDMGQVVNRLEELLHGGGRSPVERFGAAMEQAYHAFQAPALAVWRSRILIAAVGIIAVVAIGLLFQGRFGMAIAAVATGFASAVAYTIVQGVVDRTVVFSKLRQLAYSASWIDYLKVLFALAAAVAAIGLTGLWLQAALVVAVGIGFAVAFQQGLDAQVKIARTPAIRQAESALRQARIAGLDETEVRRIAAEAGGKDWEELFELLFGYEAKREQRILLEQTAGRGLRRHAAWRDSLVDYVDSRAEAIRDAKQRRELQRVEAARLKAQGVDPQEAAARAANEASKIADHGATLRVSAREYFHASPERRIALRKMVAESLNHNRPQKPTFAKRLARAPLMLVGGGARFVAGTVLLLLGLWWAQQNGVFEAAQEAAITSAGQLAPAGEATAQLTAMERLVLTDNRNPLSAAPPALARYCNGFHLAAGGLLLMASVLLRGWVGTPLAWMAGAAALVGPILLADQLEGLLPYVPPLTTAELVSFAGATLLLAAAWWFSD